MQGGVIIRKHREDKCKFFNEKWWYEILNEGVQDDPVSGFSSNPGPVHRMPDM